MISDLTYEGYGESVSNAAETMLENLVGEDQECILEFIIAGTQFACASSQKDELRADLENIIEDNGLKGELYSVDKEGFSVFCFRKD